MVQRIVIFLICCSFFVLKLHGDITIGSERVFTESNYAKLLKGKCVGLITNHAAITKEFKTTADLFASSSECKLKALFAPEHGFFGEVYAYGTAQDNHLGAIPIYTLHGWLKRRPSEEMLKGIDLLVFDIQDIGTRSYSYLSTLFYCMEESAKHKIPFIVLDRPNPLGGKVIDGVSVEKKWRSFFGYIDIPYCHGMTMGELARLFNEEYKIGCDLTVIPMKGWHRSMVFQDTGLPWVPTSPQIPEMDSPFFYPITGILGHLSILSIGIGYTLPFKIVGAPWMNGEKFTEAMNDLSLPGVHFQPFVYRPFFGKFKGETCQGTRIIITDAQSYLPYTTCYALLGVIKAQYPEVYSKTLEEISESENKLHTFHKLNGTEKIYELIKNEKFFIWKVRSLCQEERERFQGFRSKYLITDYN